MFQKETYNQYLCDVPDVRDLMKTNLMQTGVTLVSFQRTELKKKMKDQNQSTYWQETGRWGGYEECFDPQSGVWASSQISYLTFKSLIQLRRIMNTGQ